MKENFSVWVPGFAWRPENDGQGLHCDANDPGGATNKGVIASSWADAQIHGIVSGTLANASDAQLSAVLKWLCWDRCSCDDLPAGVDIMVADMEMVAGSGAAAPPWTAKSAP
jgi:lysozyme family protein